MPLRKHQQETADVIDEIIAGSDTKTILCTCTPGAGKSYIPIIAGRLIKAGLADGLCWVVPRNALQNQGERNFLDPAACNLLGNRLKVRVSTNEVNPCRGLNGFVTTYQAIGISSAVYEEIIKRRYIVILDEFHHVEKDGTWHQALHSIMKAAAFRVLMTGTLQRGDGKPIAFLPYRRAKNGGYEPDLDATSWKTVKYTRSDALKERAIIPMKFSFHDGSARWLTAEGAERSTTSIANVKCDEVGAALYTALRTEYAQELLSITINHWLKWKKTVKTAKLLIVTANYENAQKVTAMVKKMVWKRVEIATSHESVKAFRAINQYKFGDIDILVTIAMAYEGLDVPQISHIACLTHIRSTPWIEQMIARAVRIDPAYPYEYQTAFVFTPDDPLMRTIVDRIEAEQLACVDRIKKDDPPEQLSLFEEENDPVERAMIQPLGSELTGHRELTLMGDTAPNVVITPKEQEQVLLQQIEQHVRVYCGVNRDKPQQINSEIKQHFGKPRPDMSSAELALVLSHVKRNYPLSYQVRGRRMPVTKKVAVYGG